MLTTCLACHQTFPANGTLEHFPSGRRVAYDPRRGRLWAVCSACARWTLAPFESRWEALEELERLIRDRAHLLAETESIALFAVDDIEVVRVGRANLREESWWRYGREYSARRRSARRVVRRGKVIDALIFLLIAGIPFWGFSNPDQWIGRARRREFGNRAWEGQSTCPRCGAILGGLRFTEYRDLLLVPDPAGGVAIGYPCPRCGSGKEGNEVPHRLEGVTAEHLLRRLLAYVNFAGGTETGVRDAMGLVESYPSTADLVGDVASRRYPIGRLTQRATLALEIAVNEDVERRLLEMELAELEARWRQEEEIAAIADRLLRD